MARRASNSTGKRAAQQPSALPRLNDGPSLLSPEMREAAQAYANAAGISTAEALVELRKRDKPLTDDGTGATRVFGADGATVMLGEKEYHLAVFTTRGIIAFQDYIQSAGIPAIDGETLGEQFIGAALMSKDFRPIYDILSKIIAESGKDGDKLPRSICADSSPAQMRDAIDTFFKTNGLNWLESIVKTYGGQASAYVKAEFSKALTTALRENPIPSLSGTDNS